MSDPMTNAEVEDVLSSIRRLVSEDKPAEPAPEADAAPDRLVLTPSLRVSEDVPPAEQRDTQDHDLHDDLSAAEDDDASELSDFIAEHHAEGAQRAGADLSADEAETGWSTDDHAADPVDEETPIVEDYDGPETFLSYVRRGQGFRQGVQSDEVATPDEQVDPATEAETPAWPPTDALGTPEQSVAGDTVDMAADEPPAERTDDDAADLTLRDKVAALETLVAGRTDEWEPDEPGSDAYAGTEAPTLAWEDAPSVPTFSHFPRETAEPQDEPVEATLRNANNAAADHHPQQDPEPWPVENDEAETVEVHHAPSREDDGADTMEDASSASEAHAASTGFAAHAMMADDLTQIEDVLDEDALRDLIATIVREELQGALGERITRNVRKLVRREIHRALTAQDLE